MKPTTPLNALAVIALAVAAAACGADAPDTSGLPPSAQAGYDILRSSGCVGCHGMSGEGGVGPKLVGLAGSTVTLDDGSTRTADRAYLTEAITDPGAAKVKGYQVAMPRNSLDADEVSQVVDWIEAVSSVGEGEGEGG